MKMSNNKNCEYPNCYCKIQTFTCDNYIDISNPMFVAEFEITTYKRRVCKYEE